MRKVYIAHPIGGNVKTNLKKVSKIIRKISLNESNVIAVAPYFTLCHSLDDNKKEEREKGMSLSESYLKEFNIDELWVYGDVVSEGVKKEINIALRKEIKVIPLNPKIVREVNEIISNFDKVTIKLNLKDVYKIKSCLRYLGELKMAETDKPNLSTKKDLELQNEAKSYFEIFEKINKQTKI